MSDLDTEEDLLFVLPEAGHVAGVELQLVLQKLGIPHSSLAYDSLIQRFIMIRGYLMCKKKVSYNSQSPFLYLILFQIISAPDPLPILMFKVQPNSFYLNEKDISSTILLIAYLQR